MVDNISLIPVEQRSVDFYGDDLTAVRTNDGRIYAGLTQMCNAIGVDAQGQRRRIERHVVLGNGLKGVDNLSTPGGTQSGYVLRVDLIPLWLSGIRVSAVKEELRSKLEKFQQEAAAVLWEAFQEGRLTADPELEGLLQQDNDAVQAYKLISAMLKLARNQVLIEAQLDEHGRLLSTHEQQLAANSRRIEDLETTLGDPGRAITPDQSMQISQAVKAIAMVLSKASGTNQYGSVYGELYRKFGITSYKLLPANRFDEAMKFLTDWHQDLVGDIPF